MVVRNRAKKEYKPAVLRDELVDALRTRMAEEQSSPPVPLEKMPTRANVRAKIRHEPYSKPLMGWSWCHGSDLTKGVNRTNSRWDERRGRESGVHGGDWQIVAVGSGLNGRLGTNLIRRFCEMAYKVIAV